METAEIKNDKLTITENTPQQLLTLAINKGVEVAQLEKLMDLQERWEAKEARKAFLSAISKFQSDVPVLEKKKQVAFGNTKYKYAELGEITHTIKESLTNNGLSYRWEIEDNETQLKVTCIISHELGHSEKTTMSAASDKSGGKNEIQSRASSITYLSRYTLIGALGLSTANEDNDAQNNQEKHHPAASNGKITPNEYADIPKGAELPWLNDKQFERIKNRINEGDIEAFEKTKAAFRLKKDHNEQLQQAHDFTMNLKKGDTSGDAVPQMTIEVSNDIMLQIETCEDVIKLEDIYNENKGLHSLPSFGNIINKRKVALLKQSKKSTK